MEDSGAVPSAGWGGLSYWKYYSPAAQKVWIRFDLSAGDTQISVSYVECRTKRWPKFTAKAQSNVAAMNFCFDFCECCDFWNRETAAHERLNSNEESLCFGHSWNGTDLATVIPGCLTKTTDAGAAYQSHTRNFLPVIAAGDLGSSMDRRSRPPKAGLRTCRPQISATYGSCQRIFLPLPREGKCWGGKQVRKGRRTSIMREDSKRTKTTSPQVRTRILRVATVSPIEQLRWLYESHVRHPDGRSAHGAKTRQ